MKNKFWLAIVAFWVLVFVPNWCGAWGFFAHQRINRMAVFTLPPQMLPFFKQNIVYLTENAVNPDRRRYAVEGEAPRHYIDLDDYGDSALYRLPRFWSQAVALLSEDTLNAYGIVPWHINLMKVRLTTAFRARNAEAILRLSADLGHYIGDANVPLHTTSNYNGQATNQRGIHGFWESRLPELYAEDYDFFIGRAKYLYDPQLDAWRAVGEANAALDSVLSFEKELSQRFGPDKKYSYEERNKITVQTYSKAFSQAYHQKLGGQVERRMRSAIAMIGNFWYTCWVDAGQPDLRPLLDFKFSEKDKKEMEDQQQEYQDRFDKTIRPEAANTREEEVIIAYHVPLPQGPLQLYDECCCRLTASLHHKDGEDEHDQEHKDKG